MKRRIEKVINEAKQEMEKDGSYPFLPDIIDSLEAMIDGLSLKRDRRDKMAGALQRIVSDDFTFSEGPLGHKIIRLADEFASF